MNDVGKHRILERRKQELMLECLRLPTLNAPKGW